MTRLLGKSPCLRWQNRGTTKGLQDPMNGQRKIFLRRMKVLSPKANPPPISLVAGHLIQKMTLIYFQRPAQDAQLPSSITSLNGDDDMTPNVVVLSYPTPLFTRCYSFGHVLELIEATPSLCCLYWEATAGKFLIRKHGGGK